MKRHRSVLLFVLAFVPVAHSAEIFPGKTGAELRKLLREEHTPSQTFSYKAARTLMFGTIDNNAGKVELAYSTELFPITPGSPIPDHTVVNTEHTWPQSKFGHAGGAMKSDLHHLFPCRSKANSDRGNKPFAEIDDNLTKRWWNGATSQTTKPPATAIDQFSEASGSAFEPEEDHKGNVSRAMVYFFTIYEKKSSIDKPFFLAQLATLQAWHDKDIADAKEIERSKRIEAVQGNINPFVVDKTLFNRAVSDLVATTPVAGSGQGGPGAGPSGSTDSICTLCIIAALPNPTGVDTNRESVTLSNATPNDVDLTGWKLKDKAGRTFPLTGTVPSNSTLSIKLVNSTMILGNNGSSITLIDGDDVQRDKVSYTGSDAKSGSFILFGR